MYIWYTLDFTSSVEWKISADDVHIQQQYNDIYHLGLISTNPRNDNKTKAIFVKYMSFTRDEI